MDWPLPFLIISAGLSMMIMLLLMRFAPHWQHRTRLLLSAALIPWTLWWMIFALEAGAAIHHHFFEPKEGFMVGVFIITFPVALVVTLTNVVGIIGMLKLMKVTARRG